jgi:hypothetical protein
MSTMKKSDPPAARPSRDHLDHLLDQALADSFPASDPVAIDFSAPRRDERRGRKMICKSG